MLEYIVASYLERHNILGYFAAATIYPSVKISYDTGFTFARSEFTGVPPGTKRPYLRYNIHVYEYIVESVDSIYK